MVDNSMIDVEYENGRIYKVVNDIDDEIYVGATTQPLSKRMANHRLNHTKQPNRKLYAHMNKHGVGHFRIVLIEDYPCQNKEQLNSREEYWRKRLNASLNKNSCFTGISSVNYKNTYRRIIGGQTVRCECGSTCSRHHYSRHLKSSLKHQEYVEN